MISFYGLKRETWQKGARWFYAEDGLISLKNCEFLNDDEFCRAYSRGVQAAGDYNWRWRVHVGIWGARQAVKVKGGFVECGVSYGFLSSAIMTDLDWNRLRRTFYLMDTFAGLDETLLLEEEKAGERHVYRECYDHVRRNFSEWQNVVIVRGRIPDTLGQVPVRQVAYLSIDMNCVKPEIEAIAFFWDKLVPGAVVLLDDYGHRGHLSQKRAMDEFVRSRGEQILALPTGQGLLIKM